MLRSEIDELHFIAPIESVSSILTIGILSNYDSAGIPHTSVADPEVQDRREARSIPGGLRLHRYANLYFNARNAMMFRILNWPDPALRRSATSLAVLRVSPSILDLADVVVTDINAAAQESPRWHTVDTGLAVLDRDEVFAQYWNRGDLWERRRRKQRMMAEVLVPRKVPPEYNVGAYVNSNESAAILAQAAPTLDTNVNPYLFFQGPPQ